tara:strand:+ start:130 stop:900 length:771 start_codon:yes stop_codon:yes gene_type:complete
MDLKKNKKTIFLTGGTGLLGTKFLEKLSEKQYTIIYTSRKKNCIKITNKLLNLGAQGVFHIQADLENEKDLKKIVSQLELKKMFPDVLINNARNNNYSKTDKFGIVSTKNWIGELYMSVILPYKLSVSLAKMKSSKLNKIINISSFYGVRVPRMELYDKPEHESIISYGTSKAAMNHLTKELSIRLTNKKISVNAISYGGIKGKANKKFIRKYSKISPQNKMIELDEIFGPLEFLISNRSKNINGHNIIVDGGWTV